jgi:hypothetical protein
MCGTDIVRLFVLLFSMRWMMFRCTRQRKAHVNFKLCVSRVALQKQQPQLVPFVPRSPTCKAGKLYRPDQTDQPVYLNLSIPGPLRRLPTSPCRPGRVPAGSLERGLTFTEFELGNMNEQG